MLGRFRGLLVKRLILVVFVVWGVTTITFVIMYVLPRDVSVAMMGPNITPEQKAKFRHEWGLDKPFYVQYLSFYRHIVRLDLGNSIRMNRPAIQEMLDRLPITIELNLFSLIIAILMAIPLGIFSAIHRNRWFDHFVRTLSLTGISVPNFWLGLLFIYIFYYKLNIFPPGLLSTSIVLEKVTGFLFLDSLLTGNFRAFFDGLRHIIMPAFVVGLTSCGYYSRQIRTSMLQILESDYVLAAKSRGIAYNVILFKHCLKNALAPTVSLIGISLGRLFSGSLVAEVIFAWPGMGYIAYLSMLKADQPMILAFTFVLAIVYSASLFMVDIAYGILDPKIRRPAV
jgi:peptide/nickel transport system permease protein